MVGDRKKSIGICPTIDFSRCRQPFSGCRPKSTLRDFCRADYHHNAICIIPITLSRLPFFLQSNSILSIRQAGFRTGRSTFDQMIDLSRSITDGFNKPKPVSRTILVTIDFSEAFDSIWYPALFNKLILAGFPSCFARRTQSFLPVRRACVIFENQKVASFESNEMLCKDPFLALYFSLSLSMISLLLCLLLSAALFMLTIWPFGPPPPRFLLR